MAVRPLLSTTLLAALQILASGAPVTNNSNGNAPRPAALTRPTSLAKAQDKAYFDHEHLLWSELLDQHVRGDGFDYDSLKKKPGKLDDYLAQMHVVTPNQIASWSKEQRFAFWINAYNVHTIKKIVDNYPLKSIRKLSGAFGLNSVFDNNFIEMQALHPSGKNKKLSLNDIEHKILRERFKDARLHAAINCASYSCPPLRNEAFTADRLDVQLQDQMRKFVNDPKRNLIDTKKNTLRLSKIFDWFKTDFERDAKSVKEFFIRFAPKDQAEAIRAMRIKHISYDWALNDIKPID